MFYDYQTAKGHFCVKCLREHFNEGELCTRCAEREEIELEVYFDDE